MFNKFDDAMKRAMQMSDISKVPTKYLSPKKNYKRNSNLIKTVRKFKYSRGLDFGCGMGFCTVLGKLFDIDIIGIDIPTVGGIKRNKKGRRPPGPSPYLSMQTSLQKLNYPIIITDTNNFPWGFEDNEFDFIIAWFSLTKQHMDKNEWNIKDRLSEMVRITKKSGHWFVHPKSHVNVVGRCECNVKNIKVVSV